MGQSRETRRSISALRCRELRKHKPTCVGRRLLMRALYVFLYDMGVWRGGCLGKVASLLRRWISLLYRCTFWMRNLLGSDGCEFCGLCQKPFSAGLVQYVLSTRDEVEEWCEKDQRTYLSMYDDDIVSICCSLEHALEALQKYLGRINVAATWSSHHPIEE